MTGVEHVPCRPGWDCAACCQPWPCDPAREALAIETGGGTALRLLAWAYFDEYVRDTGPDGPLSETLDRFVRWT